MVTNLPPASTDTAAVVFALAVRFPLITAISGADPVVMNVTLLNIEDVVIFFVIVFYFQNKLFVYFICLN